MREWCRRDDFYYQLPHLLSGEDEDFARYIRALANEEHGRKISGDVRSLSDGRQ